MNWLIALCVGYSLGLATAAIIVGVRERLKEQRRIQEWKDILEKWMTEKGGGNDGS